MIQLEIQGKIFNNNPTEGSIAYTYAYTVASKKYVQ